MLPEIILASENIKRLIQCQCLLHSAMQSVMQRQINALHKISLKSPRVLTVFWKPPALLYKICMHCSWMCMKSIKYHSNKLPKLKVCI